MKFLEQTLPSIVTKYKKRYARNDEFIIHAQELIWLSVV